MIFSTIFSAGAPVRHRELRIEFGGALERQDPFVVVERKKIREPLVEKLLRLGTPRRHRMIDLAQAIFE
jgi:hypothetical protein